MSEQASDILWKLLRSCGIHKNKSVKRRTVLYFIITLYFLIQSLICTIVRWDNSEATLSAIEDIEHAAFNIWILIDMLLTDNYINVMKIIDSDYFSYDRYLISNEKRLLIDNCRKQIKIITKGIFFILFIHLCTDLVPPLFLSIYFSTYRKNDVIDLPTPYDGLFPFNKNDLRIYFLIYLTNVFYGYFIYLYCAAITLGSNATVMQRIVTDIQLLNTSIREMNEYFNVLDYDSEIINEKESVNIGNQNKLYKFQKQLIENHQLVIRNLRIANEAISVSSLNVNIAALLYGCISLYKFLEITNIVDTINYAFVFIVDILLFFIYCVNGQRIQNEDEKFRNALSQFNWINKPRWFRNNHLIMLLRSNKIIEVKPFGLYALNYDNFTNVMKAAYSASNVLRTVRKND